MVISRTEKRREKRFIGRVDGGGQTTSTTARNWMMSGSEAGNTQVVLLQFNKKLNRISVSILETISWCDYSSSKHKILQQIFRHSRFIIFIIIFIVIVQSQTR